MKRIGLFIFMMLVPAICFSQPSIVFDSEEYDLGEISQGDPMEYRFDFSNAGDQNLIIEKLKSS
jgi:hypothetical protein